MNQTSLRIENLEWSYLAEGNSCVIFRCEGQATVLRLKKATKNASAEFSNNDKLNFLNNIVRPVLQDDKYLIFPSVVKISDEFFQKLSRIVCSCKARPDERINSQLDMTNRDALLLPHLGFIQKLNPYSERGIENFAVEIKPKWGCLPQEVTKIDLGHKENFLACKFCMQQYLKLALGKIESCSKYCPLDLFSKDFSRIKKALLSLFNNPQNNLRVFHEGVLIYSGLPIDNTIQTISDLEKYLRDIHKTTENVSEIDGIVDVIAKILLHDSRQSTRQQDQYLSKEMSEMVKFEDQGVLNKLLSAQQIDTYGIEDIYQNYLKLQGADNFHDKVDKIRNFSSTNWQTFAERITKQEYNKEILDSRTYPVSNILYKIQRFLVAATFKDCSIMITFQKQDSTCEDQEDIIVESITGNAYKYQIKLIDLDPKSIDKMHHYFELHQEIIRNYSLSGKVKSCF